MDVATAAAVVGVIKGSLQVLQSCMAAADRLVSNLAEVHIQDAEMASRLEEVHTRVRIALRTTRVFVHQNSADTAPLRGDPAELPLELQDKVDIVRARFGSVCARVTPFGSVKSAAGLRDTAGIIAELDSLFQPADEQTDAGAVKEKKKRRSIWCGCMGGVHRAHRMFHPDVYDAHWMGLEEAMKLLEDAVSDSKVVFDLMRLHDAQAQPVPQQPDYVQPAVFERVVAALRSPSVKIVVLHGQPALGKSALAKHVWWLAHSQGVLGQEPLKINYHLCQGEYLCDMHVADKPDRLGDLYTLVTGDEEVPNENECADLLVQHMAHRDTRELLILDSLEYGVNCFSMQRKLAALPAKLQSSKLLITSRTNTVCNVLPQQSTAGVLLTRDDNVQNVMHDLMAQLVRGRSPDGAQEPVQHAHPEWLNLPAPEARVDLLDAVRSCVEQCQGCPHLLRLVVAHVRRSIGPDVQFSADLLQDDYAIFWRDCANNLVPVAEAAQDAGTSAATYAHQIGSIYRSLVLQLLPMHGVSARHKAGGRADQVSRVVRGMLRMIAYPELLQMSSKAWYWLHELQAHLVEHVAHPSTDTDPMVTDERPAPAGGAAGGPVDGGQVVDIQALLPQADIGRLSSPGRLRKHLSDHGRLVTNLALVQLVEAGLLEMRMQPGGAAGQDDPRLLRFHELLRLCLTPRPDEQNHFEDVIGPRPVPRRRTTLQNIFAPLHPALKPVNLNNLLSW